MSVVHQDDPTGNRWAIVMKRSRALIPLGSLLLALTGIVLSQLPPVRTWFGSPNLSIQIAPTISLFNNLGVLEIYAGLSLNNVGEKSGRIERIGIVLCQGPPNCQNTLELRKVVKLGDSFAPTPSQTTLRELPLVVEWLEAGDSRNEFVKFSTFSDASTQKNLSEVRLALFDFVRAAYPAYPLPPRNSRGDPEALRKRHEDMLRKILDKSYSLAPLSVGEFELVVYACSQSTIISNTYSFIIYDHDTTVYRNAVSFTLEPGGKPPIRAEVELPVKAVSGSSNVAENTIKCDPDYP